MKLRKGEALVVFIRRSDNESDSYLVAARKSEAAIHPETHDFMFGSSQIAISEPGNQPDFETAIKRAVAVLQDFEKESNI